VLKTPPLRAGSRTASSDQAESDTSTRQHANAVGSSYPLDNTSLDLDTSSPEYSTILTPVTFVPVTASSSTSLGGGVEDSFLRQLFATNLQPSSAPSFYQDIYEEATLENWSAQGHPFQHAIQSTEGSTPLLNATCSQSTTNLPTHPESSRSQCPYAVSPSARIIPRPTSLTRPNKSPEVVSSASSTADSGSLPRKRRYKCTWDGCSYSCALPKDLEKHRFKHERPDESKCHRCPNAGCGRTFPRVDNCKRHAQRFCKYRRSR
jgi:hypothetical protein